MKCEAARNALSDSFDTGVSPDAAVEVHVETCAACAAWQAELANLDGLLCQTTPVEDDPVLVARIQAAVAQARPWVMPRWLGAAVAATLIVLSMAGGWVIDTYGELPVWTWAAVSPTEPLLPDWELLRTEMVLLPMQVETEMAEMSDGVVGVWSTTAAWLSAHLQGNNLLMWGGCLGGLVLVMLINRHEAQRLS